MVDLTGRCAKRPAHPQGEESQSCLFVVHAEAEVCGPRSSDA